MIAEPADKPLAPKAGALNGIVVLEVGMVMQVPLAGQVLGDLGADVIKVERPQGDITRGLDFEADSSWRNELLLCSHGTE